MFDECVEVCDVLNSFEHVDEVLVMVWVKLFD